MIDYTTKTAMRNLVLGMLAHVDAGKTSLAEALLYKTGTISKQGRVDHKDAYLDTNYIERSRGITIFSKQAIFDYKDLHVNMLDTPGHVDFSSEMERTLSVLDLGILVVSGPDGVQSHTKTLISLLQKYKVPFVVFVNKMDICSKDKEDILSSLKEYLPSCVCYEDEKCFEELSVCDEDALDEYLETGRLKNESIRDIVLSRKAYPVFFGSALKLDGIEKLLDFVYLCSCEKEISSDFGARVFKITRDEKGNRLSHVKIDNGSIAVRDLVGDEKISQIWALSGRDKEAMGAAFEGNVYAFLGLEKTYAGEGLGISKNIKKPELMPVLCYGINILDGTDPFVAYKKIGILGEEDPNLKIVWNSSLSQIQMQLMGEIQIEVLKQLILDRFGISVDISTGKILYLESIEEPVLGVGHYEPLKHYAEVHLLLEPLPYGSGVVFESACHTDNLDLNWQRLILTNLAEKKHIGVLTGSPITDIKITLVAGRAHLKHTEGGDFRQATYRAVRQALMKAKNVLLEPYYDFILEVPSESIGRAISDVKSMGCSFDAPKSYGNSMSLNGRGPAKSLTSYQNVLLSYTKGEGKLSLSFAGYFPCHDTEKVIEDIGYEAERDVENSADSVFCSHGAGVNVPWHKVEEFMHLDSGIKLEGDTPKLGFPKVKQGNIDFDDKELEAIMLKEFGPIKRPKYSKVTYDSYEAKQKTLSLKKDYYIIDGYNLIFAFDELKELVSAGIDVAAESLISILEDFASFRSIELAVVFDAYKVKGGKGSKDLSSGVKVVYTKEGETADFFIEKLAAEIGKNKAVKIVSSDAMIQLAALRAGILRMSSREFIQELSNAKLDIKKILQENTPAGFKLKDVVRS